jgi:small subunit ribosomal protein S16
VKLRLVRVGKTKQPQYRVVAADSRSPRDGRFIEIVGQYNPRSEPSVVSIDNAKALRWLKEGAQPTERVQKLLVISGAWAEFSGQSEVSDDGDGVSAPTAAAVLEHIVRSIVDEADSVSIATREGRRRITLEVHVAPGELGRVIGKRGRTAASIRTVVRAAAARDGVEVDVDFAD